MTSFDQAERIGRPPAEVFDFLTDHEQAQRWLPAISSVEVLTPGPLGVGTRLRETRTVMGRQAQAELEVTGYERPRLYAVSNTTSGVTATYSYSLSPDGPGACLIELRCDVRAAGLRRVSAVILTAILKRQDRDHLARLRRALEAG